jgi:hypothetical protein
MEKIFLKMVDSMCEDCMFYTNKGDIWLINPKTKQWVITYYPPTNYVWWNYDFFETIYKYLSMDIKDREPIRNWIQTRMNVDVDLCEPDMLPGDYDWSGDFKVEKVVSDGKVFNF